MCLTLQLMATIAAATLCSDDAIARAAEVLRAEEGLRLTCYHDSLGYPTIGYGHRLYEWADAPITRDQAEAAFADDLKIAMAGAERVYPDIAEYPTHVQTVLICLAYQIGTKGLLSFTRMRDYLRKGDTLRAAAEIMDSHLARQTPKRARRLAALLAGVRS